MRKYCLGIRQGARLPGYIARYILTPTLSIGTIEIRCFDPMAAFSMNGVLQHLSASAPNNTLLQLFLKEAVLIYSSNRGTRSCSTPPRVLQEPE